MPIKTPLNVSPYFDDFDEDKGYHRVLSRPAVPIQARELNTIQSMFQTQIERFGNYVFKSGDIVSGCSISDIPIVPFVRLRDNSSNGSVYNISDLLGTRVVSNTTGLQAQVLYSKQGKFEVNYPDTNMIYLRYLNTGSGGQKTFLKNEVLNFYSIPGNVDSLVATVNTFANSANQVCTGNGHGISISEGIVYLNGNFVKVINSVFGIVNAYGTYAGNTHVGFDLSESIVTEFQDDTLFDNALGYGNKNAPGAHRLKLTPTLTSITDIDSVSNTEFNPIAIYNYGKLIYRKSNLEANSVLTKAIERNTYEQHGNFIVTPFAVDSITSIANSDITPANSDYFLSRINQGIAYVSGKRVQLTGTNYVNVRRGTDTSTVDEQQVTFNYGSYILLKEVAGIFDFTQNSPVTFYDKPQVAVSSKTFSNFVINGSAVGTARAKCFIYGSGIPGQSNTQYILHLFDIKYNPGKSINDVKSVYQNVGGTKAAGDLVYSTLYDSSKGKQLFGFGISGIKNLRDGSNNNVTQYVYRTKVSSTFQTNGDIVVTLPASITGGIDILPYGTGLLTDLNALKVSVALTANNTRTAFSGTVSTNSLSLGVVGSSTAFLTSLVPGDLINVNNVIRTVTSVTNNTYLTVDDFFPSDWSGASFAKQYLAGQELNINRILPAGNGSINVVNTTSFTINLSHAPSSAIGAEVSFNVLRTQVSPAQKVINKNRFIKLDTRSNKTGPWCLGVSDPHRLVKVYTFTDNTYSPINASTDRTSSFSLDTGQNDYYYGHGYLYPKPGVTTAARPYLLVQLDYFTANTTSGAGFYTIESYPIDDANTANTNAITSSNLPVYRDSSGIYYPLRDYVDFRAVVDNTANNTGVVDLANTSQVTAAVAAATVNPAKTIEFTIPSAGISTPAYGENLETSYTHYLPRIDMIYLNQDGDLRVKEGAPDPSPQTPLTPDGAMPIAIVSVPAYPSITQQDGAALAEINAQTTSIIRDVRSLITTKVITKKRYTFEEIGQLDTRIQRLEYYAELSLLEKSAIDMTITDASGLNRFKNGIFVEPFSDFNLSDTDDPEFSIAIDRSTGMARPKYSVAWIDFKYLTGGTKYGTCVTLPWNEVLFINQRYATKYRSASPSAFAWNGTLFLYPSYTSHKDVRSFPGTNITIDMTTGRSTATPPPQSLYGEWRTSFPQITAAPVKPAPLSIGTTPDYLNTSTDSMVPRAPISIFNPMFDSGENSGHITTGGSTGSQDIFSALGLASIYGWY